jgi:hypothetical protein
MRPVRRLALVLAAVGALSVGMALPAAALPTGPLISGGNTNLCLGIQGSSTASGARAVLGGCSGSPTQTWRVRGTTVVGGLFGYQFENGANLCLGVTGSSTSSGAQVIQGRCAAVSDHSQIWRPGFPAGGTAFDGFTADPGAGAYWLLNGHSGLCLGVQGSGTTGGSLVIQGFCDGNSPTQVWVI